MRSPYVAPDTGVLLAVGLGSGVDFQAPGAFEGLLLARQQAADCVLLPSVDAELKDKLGQMDAIVGLAREFFRAADGSHTTGSPQELLESVFTEIRKSGSNAFYISAAEDAMINIVRSNPGIGREALVRELLLTLARLRALVQVRIDGLGLTQLPPPPPKWVPSPAAIRGVGKADLRNLIGAGALGAERKTGVVFFEFDGPLFARRTEISAAIPWVRVTNHRYLATYLTQDSSNWGSTAAPLSTQIPTNAVSSSPAGVSPLKSGPSDDGRTSPAAEPEQVG